ncbi:MAG: DUF3575 domain-containing protein [Oligoflexus sp.]|nr:DUF3575 domain-containing protein [Pseudopedobacter sp.]
MKKLLILLFIPFNLLFAQEKKFSINTNLANIAAKGPSIALEYRFSDKWSVQAYASKGEINIRNNYSYQTFIVDVKRHLDKQLYTSSYVRLIEKDVYRPSIDYGFVYSTKGKELKGIGLSIGQTIGYEVFKYKTYNLDLFAGAGYGGFIKQQSDTNKYGFLDLRIGVLTGINF